MTYQEKFANSIRLCQNAQSQPADFVLVASPEVLGDTYEELVTSLGHLAQAGLALRIAHPHRKDGSESNQRSGDKQ